VAAPARPTPRIINIIIIIIIINIIIISSSVVIIIIIICDPIGSMPQQLHCVRPQRLLSASLRRGCDPPNAAMAGTDHGIDSARIPQPDAPPECRVANDGEAVSRQQAAAALSAEQEAELASVDRDAAELAVDPRSDAQHAGEQRARQLIEAIRAFGKVPAAVRGSSEAQIAERRLEMRLRKARQENLLSAEHEAELASVDRDAAQLSRDPARQLIEAIRAFGKVPAAVRGSSEAQIAERSLAVRLRKARQENLLSAEHEAELASVELQHILYRMLFD